MFEIFFGLIWTAISLFICLAFYAGSGGVTVNGVWVPQEEFNVMLWPKLFMGVFIVIGVVIFCTGVKKVIKNAMTSKRGDEVFGLIVDMVPSGTYINDIPVLNAKVVVVTLSGEVRTFLEEVGTNPMYDIGQYVFAKHLNDDINLTGYADGNVIPESIRTSLDNVAQKYIKRPSYDDYGYSRY